MIRDVNFFSGGGWVRGQRMGLALGDVTAAVRNNLAGADFWRKPLLNLLRLLLHLPVNEQRCWRYPCVPCRGAEQAAPSPDALTTEGRRQPPWQMFCPSWGRSGGRGWQPGGQEVSPGTTDTTCVAAPAVRTRKSDRLYRTVLGWWGCFFGVFFLFIQSRSWFQE